MSNNVIVYPTKVLPTIYINTNKTPNYNYPTHHYSTTTNQIKTTSNTPYQTYTTPVYYNYTQNTNNYTSNYSGELERQTYKNTPNIKIAENYGIIDQNNLQKIQMHKRPSTGMTQNYQNINLKTIPNTNNVNNIHYKVNYNQYTQPQPKSKITNMNNYYYTNTNNNINNVNNINNYIYNEKNNRKYNYEYTDNSMYIVQIQNNKTNAPKIIQQKNINTTNQIITQNYNQKMNNQNVNNNIYYNYQNQPPPKQPQHNIIVQNQPKNIIPNQPNKNIIINPNIPTHHHHTNNNVNITNNIVTNNQVNMNKINNQMNNNINNMNNIPKKNNNIILPNQINPQVNKMNYNNINNNIQNYNVYPPQHNMPIPQVKKEISQPVTTNNIHPTLEEPPDNMRKRGKILNLNANISHENFNNTMPNLRPNADIYNNIPIPKQEKTNYLIQPSFGMTFDGKNKNENINSNASIVMNKRTKVYISNVPQKINAFSFSSSKPTQNNNIKINQNMINNNIVKENNNMNNYQNKPQIQKNNKIIINSNKPENVEYRDQYGNILVNINGKLIDKRLLINNNPNPNPNP